MFTYKIAHLVGVTRNREKEFRHAEMILTKKGYIVFAPVIYDFDIYKSLGEYPNILDHMCTQKLHMCDFIVIVTTDHIGKSTKLRIEQANTMGKPIYTLENDELVPFDPATISESR